MIQHISHTSSFNENDTAHLKPSTAKEYETHIYHSPQAFNEHRILTWRLTLRQPFRDWIYGLFPTAELLSVEWITTTDLLMSSCWNTEYKALLKFNRLLIKIQNTFSLIQTTTLFVDRGNTLFPSPLQIEELLLDSLLLVKCLCKPARSEKRHMDLSI